MGVSGERAKRGAVMATDVASELLSVVEAAVESLNKISDPEASLKSTTGNWSEKEILGHLIDFGGEQSPSLRQGAGGRGASIPSL
jgi:hypothetical protein